MGFSKRQLLSAALAWASVATASSAWAHGRPHAKPGSRHGLHKAAYKGVHGHGKDRHGKGRHGETLAEAPAPAEAEIARTKASIEVDRLARLDPDGLIRRPLLAQALVALERHRGRIMDASHIFIADFAKHSSDARFYHLDMTTGEVKAVRTAHGRGSDPDRSGWARRFSNTPNSFASSLGAYVTLGVGHGFRHGTHVALDGLEASNSAAKAREIIVHSADYCEMGFLRAFGMLGRSEGCFATSSKEFAALAPQLGEGRLLYAGV